MASRSGVNVAVNLLQYLTDPDTKLPKRITLRRLINSIKTAHDERGGASVHPSFGDLRGQALFAISLFPERTVRIVGRHLPGDLIETFIRRNADLLSDPRVILGSWYNSNEDTTYLDVSVVTVDGRSACALGSTYNQIAVFDLAQETVIDLDGTGEEIADLLPEPQRLPPLDRNLPE